MKESNFTKGYYCCLAAIISAHGVTTAEEDALRCIGKPTKLNCDPYDLEILKESGIIETVYPPKKKEAAK